MADTLKNIIEARDPEAFYLETIKTRIKSIKHFQQLGHPDLCYLTKEFQKSLSFSKQPNKFGFFHYIYGLDASSPASVSAHLKRLLQLQEKEKTWFSNGRWKITKGLFCIYDAFSKIDIHVEIGIPGGMKLYGYKGDESLVSVDEALWERGYISSVLRHLKQEPSRVFKIYDLLSTKDQLFNFLDTFKNFHLKHTGFSYVFDSDVNLETLGNKPLFLIINYLITRKLMDIALKFIQKIIDSDLKTIVFQGFIFEKMGKAPEAIQCMAKALVRHPHTSVFLYKQANLLMEFRKFDLALDLAKIVVQLNPESFDAWLLLIKCYYGKKNYSMVLLTMNSTPILTSTVPVQTTPTSPVEGKSNNLDFTNPEEKIEINIYDFSFIPNAKNLKFTRFSEELLLAHQEFLEENEKVQHKLEGLAFSKLESQEKILYEILVKIEGELGWDKLLALRGELFFMESDGTRFDYITKNSEDYMIDYNEEEIQKEDTGQNNKVNDSSDEDQEHQLPSFLQNEDDNDEQIKKLKNKLNVINKETSKTLNMWDQRRSKKITELTNETYETEGPQIMKNVEENLPKIPEINEENKGDQESKKEETKEKEELLQEKEEQQKEKEEQPIEKQEQPEEKEEKEQAKEKEEPNENEEPKLNEELKEKEEPKENEEPLEKTETKENEEVKENQESKEIAETKDNEDLIKKEKKEVQEVQEETKEMESEEQNERIEEINENSIVEKDKKQKNHNQSIPKVQEKENETTSLIKNEDSPQKNTFDQLTNPQEIILSKTGQISSSPPGALKRLCSKTMDALFLALFEDLNTYYEWEAEEGFEKEHQKAPKQSEETGLPQFNGVIWILRGLLAERLLKEQASEVAYRKAVEIGFNLFAWYQMIKLYTSKKTWKAVIVCVGEVLEEIEHEGVKTKAGLPRWIEEVVLECISEMGIKKFFELLKELNLNNDSLNKLVRESENWKIMIKN